MRLERLSKNNEHLFNSAFSLYESAFPREERRDMPEQKRAMNNPDYHFDLIIQDRELLGVMLYWETDSFVFLEHFTTMPKVRGNGYGAAALDLLKAKGKTILLEIETPTDEMTHRRYEFYKRNGFVMNPYYHIQAKYHLGDEDLELKILSYPRELTKEEYRGFYEYMTREIGIQAKCADDITIRELQDGDDLAQVARLIYLTDPYIYPNWFDTLEDGIKVISEMISLPTMYSKENVTVAVTDDGYIAGVFVARMTPFTEKKEALYAAFKKAGVRCDSRTDEVFNAYYKPMGGVEDGYYIANIGVDPDYRKRGIAAAMISEKMRNKELCTLECVIANSGSWRLYQRLGFKIAYEYPGVHGIPCYKMIYRR